MEVSQYYTIFKYRPLRPQGDLSYQDITIVTGTGVNLETFFFFQGTSRRNFRSKSPHMRCSWVTWKHHWPPKWVRLVGTQVGTSWIRSSNLDNQKKLVIQYILWMGQGHRLQYQVHMRNFQQCFQSMDKQRKCFRWIMKKNEDARSMEG